MSSSLWASYLKERLDQDCIEYDWGFLSYKITGLVCDIFDLYVAPEEREKGYAKKLADEVTEIAKGRQCNTLVGYVWPGVRGSEISLQAMLNYGFVLLTNDGARTILTKGI